MLGALLATFICGRLEHQERPAGRLLLNLLAATLACAARSLDALVDSIEGANPISATSDFLRSKFVSSASPLSSEDLKRR